jgi:hypothetical protein
MTSKRPITSLLAVLGAASLLSLLIGCGGNEEQLTKAQFLKQGNAICKQAGAEQAELASHYKKGQVAPGEFGVVTAVFVPPMEKELRRLKALAPPQDDEKQVQAILKGIEKGIKDAKFDYLDLFVKQTDPFVQANEQAQKYGLDICAGSSHAVITPHGP